VGNTSYWIREGAVFRVPNDGKPEICEVSSLSQEPALQQRTGDFLASENASVLTELLHSLTNMEPLICYHVLDRQRRWWIGSLMKAARQMLSPESYTILYRWFGKLLRKWNVDPPILENRYRPRPGEFVVMPHEEPDVRYAVFTQREVEEMAEQLRSLLSSSPRFSVPSIYSKNADPQEWDEYVHGLAHGFAHIPELGIPNLKLITRIG
jgi:hypothetical protein